MEELDRIDLPLQLEADEIQRLTAYLKHNDPTPLSVSEAVDLPIASQALCLWHANQLIAHRQHREHLFVTPDRFRDPEWEIMLNLYVAQAGSVDVNLSCACVAAMIPVTTALRYLSFMVEQGMLETYHRRKDNRQTYIRLSGKSISLMNRHLSYLVELAANSPQAHQ